MEKREKMRENGTLALLPLKKRHQITDMHTVLRFLLHLCHRPAIRFGLARDSRSPHRNTRFASFMAENNRSVLDPNLYDTVLRGRKLMRQLLLALLAGGGIWVAVESARALTVF
jgi:hypothetical protein